MKRTVRTRAPAPPATPNSLPTSFLLLAQYGGRVIVPLDEVCRDFFAHLLPEALARKVSAGQIALPIVRMDALSKKAVKGVHLSDLADFIDARRAAAWNELEQISCTGGIRASRV